MIQRMFHLRRTSPLCPTRRAASIPDRAVRHPNRAGKFASTSVA
jgi:hypothetical protein